MNYGIKSINLFYGKTLYLNDEIKDEVYIGYGTLEFGKFPSINERKLPNNLKAEKFKVLFAVHKGYQKRLKEDYIKIIINLIVNIIIY